MIFTVALSDRFLRTLRAARVKNSWSPNYHNLPPPAPGGYHDLYMKYLDGPAKNCVQTADGSDSTDDCFDDTPLNAFILPPGY